MKHLLSIQRSAFAVFLLILATAQTISAVEPAKTNNGAFWEGYFIVDIGPTVNFFAPVENLVTPEDYFQQIGANFIKIDEDTYHVSAGEYTTLAQAYQSCQETGIYTINPPIEKLQLEQILYTQVVGPPYHLNKLWNFSVRSEVKTGDAVSIGGLVVPGKHPKIVVIRALGPSLEEFGIENPLPDPTIHLFRDNRGVKFPPDVQIPASTMILENDNHQSNYVSTESLLSWVNLDFPAEDSESVIATILDPGIYTTLLSSVDGESGIALLEFYILDSIDVTNTFTEE